MGETTMRPATSPRPPPNLAEVAFGQLAADIERKARLYIDQTDGLIRTVIVLGVAVPDARRATFSLWVADPSGKSVLTQEAVVHDAAADMQPDGQVRLFAGDFFSEALETLPVPWVIQTLLRRKRFSNSRTLYC
ncbi:hypothetical protein CPLU01_15922 [Colletotrichum plurivorum]|uniref:Uncharacterized protein n=1 Tax=Colletotrichum plurivorum TaxID=2175906 RepID=A0A8H6J4H4_9PEZI|nr:hypothetical protein CPLU01_15922 [Colletotrichum plurivorum]